MPIAAYSTLLWEQPAPNASGIPVFSPIVPVGFVWVVRSVSAYNTFEPRAIGIAHLEFQVDGYPTWNTPIHTSRCSTAYESGDVRWVTAAGTFLSFTSTSANWKVRVSGYQLQAAPGP